MRSLLMGLALCLGALGQDWKPIERRIPPKGVALPTADAKRLMAESRRLQTSDKADVAVFGKAVEWAIRGQEFQKLDHVKIADEVLAEGAKRLDAETPRTGLVVRGYRSTIDGSLQPYGLDVPPELDLSQAVPLYVWLHGRGDKTTDMYFIHQRMTRPGKIHVPHGIIVHPFGRHCMGFKHAGEIDVLEVIAAVQRDYTIDPNRVFLMGFSMGGAGAWHIGAHYADHFAAISPGAGFAETARYNRLKPDAYPPLYEQTLWGLYDVPNYVRNLFNQPLIAYSGENDKQIQAARVMEEAFQTEGQVLDHRIGPGMGHKYHPDTLAEIMTKMKKYPDRKPQHKSVHLQTRTLRYNTLRWVEATRLETHWEDSRIDATRTGSAVAIRTRNIAAFRIHPKWSIRTVVVDGRRFDIPGEPTEVRYVKQAGTWQLGEPAPGGKSPGLQGPIDDAFMAPFLVVSPSGTPRHAQWVAFELNHLRERWATLFRAQLPEKRDLDVTEEDIATKNLILWGDATSNTLIQRVSDDLPWHEIDETRQLEVLIQPNPLKPERYLVINSGPTFRPGHDRTNSQQNPKLPDWAILDVSAPPTDTAAGRVLDAGFYNEDWKFDAQ